MKQNVRLLKPRVSYDLRVGESMSKKVWIGSSIR